MGSGIFASGLADPFLNLQYLHSLLPSFPSIVVYLPNFLLLQATGSPQNSLHLPRKLVLCEHGEAQQPDWAQSEFCEEFKGQQQWHHSPSYKQSGETRIAKLN